MMSAEAATQVDPRRAGFSLLEVIIATAIMAGSALVLMSLLGLGSTFGRKAEQRTHALSAAQSVMDEFLAMPPPDSSQQETTGVLEGSLPLSYRLSVAPYMTGRTSEGMVPTGLSQITVEVFEADRGLSDMGRRPLCTLSRLVRDSAIRPFDPNRRSELGEDDFQGQDGAGEASPWSSVSPGGSLP